LTDVITRAKQRIKHSGHVEEDEPVVGVRVEGTARGYRQSTDRYFACHVCTPQGRLDSMPTWSYHRSLDAKKSWTFDT
jgi:hypothetical protein